MVNHGLIYGLTIWILGEWLILMVNDGQWLIEWLSRSSWCDHRQKWMMTGGTPHGNPQSWTHPPVQLQRQPASTTLRFRHATLDGFRGTMAKKMSNLESSTMLFPHPTWHRTEDQWLWNGETRSALHPGWFWMDCFSEKKTWDLGVAIFPVSCQLAIWSYLTVVPQVESRNPCRRLQKDSASPNSI